MAWVQATVTVPVAPPDPELLLLDALLLDALLLLDEPPEPPLPPLPEVLLDELPVLDAPPLLEVLPPPPPVSWGLHAPRAISETKPSEKTEVRRGITEGLLLSDPRRIESSL